MSPTESPVEFDDRREIRRSDLESNDRTFPVQSTAITLHDQSKSSKNGVIEENCPMSQQCSLHAHVELQRSIDSIIENICSREDAKESEVNLSD